MRETSQTLLAAGDAKQALDLAERSRDLVLKLPGADLELAIQAELAKSHNRIGEALARLDLQADALNSFRRALFIREKLAAADKNPEAQDALASAYERTGDAAYLAGDDGKAEAAGLYEKSFGVRDALAKAAPDVASRQEALAVAYERLARIAGDRGEDPVDWYRKIVAIRKTLVKAEPKNMTYLASLGTSYDAMGAMLECSDEAIDALGKALEIRRKLVEETPDNADWQVKLAKSLERLASCDRMRKRASAKRATSSRASTRTEGCPVRFATFTTTLRGGSGRRTSREALNHANPRGSARVPAAHCSRPTFGSLCHYSYCVLAFRRRRSGNEDDVGFGLRPASNFSMPGRLARRLCSNSETSQGRHRQGQR